MEIHDGQVVQKELLEAIEQQEKSMMQKDAAMKAKSEQLKIIQKALLEKDVQCEALSDGVRVKAEVNEQEESLQDEIKRLREKAEIDATEVAELQNAIASLMAEHDKK
eukprot:9412793-Ditylum_brightwellii.AAC.1